VVERLLNTKGDDTLFNEWSVGT